MSEKQSNVSAALYFGREKGFAVPITFYERARRLLDDHGLQLTHFTADGGGFEIDEPQMISCRGDELLSALRIGAIGGIGLYSPYVPSDPDSDWQIAIDLFSSSGCCYLEINQSLGFDTSNVLLRAYELTKGLLNVRYGISYLSSQVKYPGVFAIGGTVHSLADFREIIPNSRQSYPRKKTADELWSDELVGEQRHLGDLFRGAYPASIITETHIRAAALRSRGIGRLTEIDNARWLWELSESERPEAQSILESRHVLVCQASED